MLTETWIRSEEAVQGQRRRGPAAACAAELAEVALRGISGRTTQRDERRGEAVVRVDYATVRARRWRVAAVDRRSALVSSGEWRKKVTDLYPWPRVLGQKLNRYLCRP